MKIFIFLLVFFFLPCSTYSEDLVEEYLCELGIQYFKSGRYKDALHEFSKALILNPYNATANEYKSRIFSLTHKREGSREEIITKAVEEFERETLPKQISEKPKLPAEEPTKRPPRKLPTKEILEKPELPETKIRITGETQLRVGVTSEDVIWKQANWDLNEKNWRILSDNAYDRYENTYDSRIFDRFRLNLDIEKEEGLGFHSTFIIDPWSFTGKTDKVTIVSSWGVPAEFELKYWSNTRYTTEEIGYTIGNGDTFIIPEIKVVNGKTRPETIYSNWSGEFNLPELKIHREFQPLRELWFDYKQEGLNFRFFPFAYENQALTFDDPLRLSNNHIWWEESPWLRRWRPGIYNSIPVDFTKGWWDNSISFPIRDSEGCRLTQLRGFSMDIGTKEETLFQGSFASPKHPWQEYSEIDNIIWASRIKHRVTDNLSVGGIFTTRMGFNPDQKDSTDSRNYVGGVDLCYEVGEGVLTSLELATSESDCDLTNRQYRSKYRGNAYYFSLIGRYPREKIKDVEYGYDGISPNEDEKFFTKFRLFGCHMDRGFNSSLSSYRETRKDEFWSRHIQFRQPFKYYYIGFYREAMTWDDIKSYRIGNGIDVGRDVLGLRIESSLWNKTIENLFDVRNVHDVNGKFIENVSREEFTWNINKRLTTKVLGIHHHLPRTKGGIDPFVFNRQTGLNFENTQIEDGKDCSIKTVSFGLEYKFFDWLSLNGIWERTNDYYLGYDGFPRSILIDGNNSYVYWKEGRRYRQMRNWLYSQEYFPNPPYPYYDIFKTGLTLKLKENLEIYLDYTRNEYEKAGQNDDNINHVGLEISYTPISKLKFFLKYSYCRWQDLDRLIQGITEPTGHHNFFIEAMYKRSEDEDLVFQYGEAGRFPAAGEIFTVSWDPYGGSLRTLDTRHIFRLYYRRKF